MARGMFDGEDIEIFLSEEDIISLDTLKIEGKRLVCEPLEVILELQGEKSLKAIIQKARPDFSDIGDGIKVEKTDYGFFVSINQQAYDRIVENPLSGTRYNPCGSKINFRRE